MSGPGIRRWLLALCGVVVVAVTACGGSNTSTATNPYATQNPNAVNGGQLTVGVWQPSSSFLNAGVVQNLVFSYIIDAPAAEGLLWYRGSNETASASTPADYYQPWLATEIPTLANHDVKLSGCPNTAAKMCVTWKLRSGVQWHDGSYLSSKDVCDTYDLYWLKYKSSGNPTTLSSTTPWNLALDCQATGNLTATIDYSQTFGSYLSLGTGVLGILPASELDPALATGASIETYAPNVDLGAGSGRANGAYRGSGLTLDQMIDGTGPYVFSSADANQIVYVKNQNYWNKDHQPHLDKIVFKNEPDLATEVADAKSGNIDVGMDMRQYNLDGLDSAAAAPGAKFSVQVVPEPGAEKIDLNLCANDVALCGSQAWTSKYTADPVIRKAMLEGINRQNIIQQEVGGKTTIPKDSFMYLGASWINSSKIPQTKYSVSAANQDLSNAGYKIAASCGTDSAGNGFRAYKDGTCIAVNLGTPTGNDSRQKTEFLIQQDLAKIGIKVVTPFAPSATNGVFFGAFADGGPLYTHKFDLAMYTNTLFSPGEPDNLYPIYHGACGGSCATTTNGITSATSPNGQNDTGINDPTLDSALDAGHSDVDPAKRAADYVTAEQQLAKDIPEIPLYQQVTINSYTRNLQGVKPTDLVWDFNVYDWFCLGGNCQPS